MVDCPEQLDATRALLESVAADSPAPLLGSMIETPTAAENAAGLAQRSAFLSIGTNDLTAATLGADRFAGGAARAHDPRVLRLIARTVAAAHEAGIAIEVCGEAASDPVMLPLLVGLGVDEVSVGAARVGVVRRWVRSLRAGEAGDLARVALGLDSAEEVALAARPLARALSSAELGDGGGKRVERGGGVHALGA